MQAYQKHRLQMLRRVRSFLEPYRDSQTLSGAITELEGVIARLARFGTEQDASERRTRSLSQDVLDRSRELRQYFMRPVALIGRRVIPTGIASSTNTRGLVLPKQRDHERTLTAAIGLADAVEGYEDRLVAAGLPKEHLAEMRAAAEALRTLMDARAQDRGRRIAATTGVMQEASHGVALVGVLNSLVLRQLRGDAALLAEWRATIKTARGGGGGSPGAS